MTSTPPVSKDTPRDSIAAWLQRLLLDGLAVFTLCAVLAALWLGH